MTTAYYVLNRNEGTDTVHRNPREECNTDDADGRETIDPETALQMLTRGAAVACGHCYDPKEPIE